MKSISKPNTVFVQDEHILINGAKEFAILRKRPNERGYQWITFSMPITARDISVIDNSGIAKVESFSISGTILFSRKDFYDHTKMYELIIDILSRHEKTAKLHKHIA